MRIIDFKRDNADLVLNPATGEWEREVNSAAAVKQLMIESLEQPFGDDIDFPQWHSLQQNQENAIEDDTLPIAARITDAERVLAQHPEIDPDSIDIDIEQDLSLSISLELWDNSSIVGVTL